MAEIVVREAVGHEDVAAVRALLRDYGAYLAAHPAGAANICIEGYEQELEGLPKTYFALLLAEVDGFAAGCVALRRVAKDESGCEMKRLWVDGAFRGLRLGRRLVQEAITWAKRLGLRRCIWIRFRRLCRRLTVCMQRWDSSERSGITRILLMMWRSFDSVWNRWIRKAKAKYRGSSLRSE